MNDANNFIDDFSERRTRMNSRDRVVAAINHQKTDKIPIDLGGYQSGICWKAYNGLKEYLNINTETEILEPIQMLAKPEEIILQKFEVDTRYVFPDFFSDPVWEDDYTFTDSWGIKWQRQPAGNYHNKIYRPLSNYKNKKELDNYNWPKADDLLNKSELQKNINRYQEGKYAIFTSLSGVFEQAWYLRGFEKFFTDLVENRSFIEDLLDRVLEVLIANYSIYFDAVGENLDCVQFWGDVGGQNGPLLSPNMYRDIIMPREKRLIEFTKEKTDAFIGWHSCGSCEVFISDFIDIGIDILNPVQLTAKNMEPEKLKSKYGSNIAFWGAIDGQELLPRKSPEEVRDAARNIIKTLSKNGGYLLASCHNIQNDVSAENIVALFDEANKFET